jgi:hypothetical protein
MKLKRALVLGVIAVVVLGSVSVSWSGEIKGARAEDIVDLVVLRPVGCVVTLAGTGLFLLTLPFTVPTHSVNEAAERFVVAPFEYTFSRPFPDPNL